MDSDETDVKSGAIIAQQGGLGVRVNWSLGFGLGLVGISTFFFHEQFLESCSNYS